MFHHIKPCMQLPDITHTMEGKRHLGGTVPHLVHFGFLLEEGASVSWPPSTAPSGFQQIQVDESCT